MHRILTSNGTDPTGDTAAGIAAAQWLSLRLQLLAAAVIAIVAALGVASTAGMLPAFASYHHRYHLSARSWPRRLVHCIHFSCATSVSSSLSFMMFVGKRESM